jgi:hypothetical protein
MKRIILVLTAALLLAAMSVAVAPAMAQDQTKDQTKMEDTKAKEDTKGKAEEKKGDQKDLPKSGGVPVSASLLGLGAGVLLVGGGLVALRVVRQERH